MLYNFDALNSSSDDSGDEPIPSLQNSPASSIEERQRAEIRRLELIRDRKRTELLAVTKGGPDDDAEHQAHVKELSKQILKLSRATEENRQIATEREQKCKSTPTSLPPGSQTKPSNPEVQSEIIRNLRVQNASLKTEIQKAKRVLAQEGGSKNRALQIKKLKQQLEDLPRAPSSQAVEYLPPKQSQPTVDLQTLRADIADLSAQHKTLELKLKGLASRVSTLEKADLKTVVNSKLAVSGQNDVIIERLRPKEQKKPLVRKFRGHIGQQSRLSVIILGLNRELVERNRELNHSAVQPNEAGVSREIERLQKRLHLLESSLSCFI
jgi:hypothetical protein